MAITSTLKQIIEPASTNLGLFVSATATVVDGASVTVPHLLDASPDADHLRNTFITKEGDTFRRITQMDSTGVLTLTSALSGLSAADAIGIYFLLDPVESRAAFNEELQGLQYKERYELTLVENDNEYALPTDMQDRGQILGVRFRYVPTSGVILEEEAPSYQFQESANALTIRFIHLPVDIGNLTAIFTYRKRYASLANDTATTTCPYTLAVRAAEVAMIRKCVKKFGSSFAKNIFGMEMILSEREYERLKFEHTPVVEPADLYQDMDWSGPDIPSEVNYPSW